jgi:hypothetical protein
MSRRRQKCVLLAGGLVAALFPLFACGGSSDSPTSPSATPASPSSGSPSGPSTASLAGRTVDALTSQPLAALSIRLDNGSAATSSGDGTFAIATSSGQHAATISGQGIVERQTNLRAPASGLAVSLIPSGFDLAAFSEMCRGGENGLRRWDAAPSLVVIEAVLEFTSSTDAAYKATAERLTSADRESLVADFGWGLSELTGGAFGGFRTVSIESPEAGSSVSFFSREGAIVVARFRGLRESTGSLAFGRWANRSSLIVAGAVMLDRDFDAGQHSLRRALRVHELGHALGWSHVSARASAMNAVVGTEPNAFDREATRLAFLRPPGNTAPDRDPSAYSVNLLAAPIVWGPIIQ